MVEDQGRRIYPDDHSPPGGGAPAWVSEAGLGVPSPEAGLTELS